MKQTEKILDHLKRHGSITPQEALREYGCMRLGARIYDLRREGHAIEREMVTAKKPRRRERELCAVLSRKVRRRHAGQN